NLLLARELVNAAVIAARRLQAAGSQQQAVELLLDAATFAADHARAPLLIDQMIGAALVQVAAAAPRRAPDPQRPRRAGRGRPGGGGGQGRWAGSGWCWPRR